GIFSYEMYFKESILAVSHSPNSIHTIKVVEKGETAFFSPSLIRLKYKNEHFDTKISNDGKNIDLSNVEINWKNNEEATIILDGEEQAPEVIIFKVPDSNNSPSFKVEYIELGYIPTFSRQDPLGDYE